MFFKVIDRQIYKSNPDWESFYQNNEVRAGVNDHVDIWRIKENIPAGLIWDDIDLFYNFGLRDPSILDTDHLKELHAIMDDQASWRGIPKIKKIKNILIPLRDWWPYWIVIVLLTVSFLLWLQGDRRYKYLYFLPGLFAIAPILAMGMTFIIKERVVLSAVIPFIVYSIALFQKIGYKRNTDSFFYVVLIISAIPIIASLKTLPSRQKERTIRKENRELLSFVKAYAKPLFVAWPFSMKPMGVSKDFVSLVSFGWAHDIPGGISIHSYDEIINDEDFVFVIDNEGQAKLMSKLQNIIKFHYGVLVEEDVLYETNSHRVIRLVRE